MNLENPWRYFSFGSWQFLGKFGNKQMQMVLLLKEHNLKGKIYMEKPFAESLDSLPQHPITHG